MRGAAAVDKKPTLFWSKAWYFTSFGTSGLLMPLLNLYFRRSGLTEAQIGVITAMRPWTSAIAGNLWASLGDQTGAYRTIVVVAHICSSAGRYCIGLSNSFPLTLGLVIATEAMTAPLQIMADASAMAVGPEANYGKARLWGAIGWGACSPVCGLIVSNFGEMAAFNANLVGSILTLLPTALLPTGALKQRQLEKLRRGHNGDAETDALLLADDHDMNPSGAAKIMQSQGSDPLARPGPKAGSLSYPSLKDDAPTTSSPELETSDGDEQVGASIGRKLVPALGVSQEEEVRRQALRSIPQGANWSCLGPSRGSNREKDFLCEVADCLPASTAPGFVACEPGLDQLLLYRHQHTENTALPYEKEVSDSEMTDTEHLVEDVYSLSQWQKLRLLFSDPELIVFLFMAVLFGFAVGTIDGYLFLYLDILGAPEVLMGLTITVSCVIELPIFHYMGQILHFVGVQQMLHWVMLVFLIRLLCYSLLSIAPSPWLVVVAAVAVWLYLPLYAAIKGLQRCV